MALKYPYQCLVFIFEMKLFCLASGCSYQNIQRGTGSYSICNVIFRRKTKGPQESMSPIPKGLKNQLIRQNWWHMSKIPVIGSLMQEDYYKFQASLSCIVSPSQNKMCYSTFAQCVQGPTFNSQNHIITIIIQSHGSQDLLIFP